MTRRRLQAGSTLLHGRFILERQLGAGGMGVVHQALDTTTGTRCALKMLSRIDPANVYRLKKEFRSLADVVHENLVGLHELFADDEEWFFTMDLVEGVPFTEWVRSGLGIGDAPTVVATERASVVEPHGGHPSGEDELDEPRLRSALAELVAGVAAIHAAGKLHRDLKPSNVLVTREGRVVILDFGLAGDQSHEGATQTIDRLVAGTPAYMAPEQLRGEKPTPASDWYAAGVMLFEALTGRLPFEGTLHAVLASKSMNDAPRVSELAPGTPADLASLCEALLGRDPAERPGSAAIAAALGTQPAPSGSRGVEIATPMEWFVGRDAELALLDEALAEARKRSEPTFVLVRGASGMGKTALIERFLERRALDATSFAGRCRVMESVPFKAFDGIVDALSRHLSRMSAADAAMLMPRDVRALADVFPALGRLQVVERARSRPSPIDAFERRRRAGYALKELLCRMSDEAPLVLWVDDIQWADRDSVGLLRDIGSPPDAPRMLFLASHRPEGGELRDAIVELGQSERSIHVRQVEVGRLDDDSARRLARQALSTGAARSADFDGIVETACRDAEGCPLFVLELAHALQSSEVVAGRSLDDLLRSRIEALEAGDRSLLELVCLATGPVDARVLAGALGARGDVHRQLRNLTAGRWIRSSGGAGRGRVEPYHDRVREVVVRGIEAPAASARHRALAWALVETGTDDSGALVHHLEAAGQRDQAFDQAVRAADQVAAALAFERAAALYERAIALAHAGVSVEKLIQNRASALADAGHGRAAAELYLRLAEVADEQERAELHLVAAELLVNGGEPGEGLDLLCKVLGEHGVDLPRDPEAALLYGLSGLRELEERGFEFCQRAPALIDARDLRVLQTLGSGVNGLASHSYGHMVACIAIRARIALTTGHPLHVMKSLAHVAMVCWLLGLDALGARALSAAEALDREKREDHTEDELLRSRARWDIEFTRTMRDFAATRYARALVHCDETVALMERGWNSHGAWRRGIVTSLAAVRRFSADLLFHVGRIDEMNRLRAELLQDARARGDGHAESQVLLASVWQPYVANDEADHALRCAEAYMMKGDESQRVLALALSVGCLAYLGRSREAERLLEGAGQLLSAGILRAPGYQFIASTVRAMAFGPMLDHGGESADRARRGLQAVLSEVSSDERPHPARIAACARAMLARVDGDERAALDAILSALDVTPSAELLNVAVLRWAEGAIRGGTRGEALARTARDDLARMGVKNPFRLARVMTLGLVRSDAPS